MRSGPHCTWYPQFGSPSVSGSHPRATRKRPHPLGTWQVQQYAAQALRSGFTNPLMERLAALGSDGRFVNNIHRQLLVMFKIMVNGESMVCRTQARPSDHPTPPSHTIRMCSACI